MNLDPLGYVALIEARREAAKGFDDMHVGTTSSGILALVMRVHVAFISTLHLLRLGLRFSGELTAE